ncbi:MAG TPA: hypothetical protein VFA45_06080 [Actinomycetes bacterium]|nr:hypothetical protein [Actinomycetes bacterium]
MDASTPSPFETLETCFRLLTIAPTPLALDGRQLGHGLPARLIPLGELRVLLQHPATSRDLQHAALEELIHLATQHRGEWIVGFAGVLLPGLRRIAASVASVDRQAAIHVEGDLLELIRNAIGQHVTETADLALDVLQFTDSSHLPFPVMMGQGDPLGA